MLEPSGAPFSLESFSLSRFLSLRAGLGKMGAVLYAVRGGGGLLFLLTPPIIGQSDKKSGAQRFPPYFGAGSTVCSPNGWAAARPF